MYRDREIHHHCEETQLLRKRRPSVLEATGREKEAGQEIGDTHPLSVRSPCSNNGNDHLSLESKTS